MFYLRGKLGSFSEGNFLLGFNKVFKSFKFSCWFWKIVILELGVNCGEKFYFVIILFSRYWLGILFCDGSYV